jgi:tetratricopeptide (TPR) repeat protein
MKPKKTQTVFALILALASALLCDCVAQENGISAYDQSVFRGRTQLAEGKLKDAFTNALTAISVDQKRFEAYALAALVLAKQGASLEASNFLQSAIARAPESKKSALAELGAVIAKQSADSTKSEPHSGPAQLTGEARRKYDALLLIAEDADKAKSAEERQKLLLEFFTKSAPFVRDNPKVTPIWLLRAAAGLELDWKFPTWQAGRKLIELGADSSDDAKTRKVLAQLDRKGWLEPKAWAKPEAGKDWENSLAMKFKPVPGARPLFCIWETRVRDFAVFVSDTGYDATEGMWTVGADGWKQRGGTWQKPGFEQTPLHPVSGVNWLDSVKFCEWLTQTERKAGLIGGQDEYRLLSDDEWSAAVGDMKYPWGDAWPPPQGAGNYADAGSDINPKIENYRDGFNRTAPVGSFNPNRLGLYDLGGNVWEWCADWYRKSLNTEETRKEIPALDDDGGGETYRVLRGAAWCNNAPVNLRSSCRGRGDPGLRDGNDGFRCVLVVGGGAR